VLASERYRRFSVDCLSSRGARQTRRFNPITDWESVQREGRHVDRFPLTLRVLRAMPFSRFPVRDRRSSENTVPSLKISSARVLRSLRVLRAMPFLQLNWSLKTSGCVDK
jgi:hypothetical protein